VVAISSTSAVVTLSDLSIRNGYNAWAGAGIATFGILTINNSTVTGNRASYYGGGISNAGSATYQPRVPLGDGYRPPFLRGGQQIQLGH
jgi:hypothetical protein